MRLLIFPKPELQTLKVMRDFLRLVSEKTSHELFLSEFTERDMSDLGLSRANEGDLVIVFGGDGTFIRACKHHPDIPVVGVNTGSFGFLCEFEENDYPELVEYLSSSDPDYVIQSITRLEARYDGNTYEAINDIVVSYAAFGKPGVFSIYVDQHRLYTAKADGVVISSPIGSSAYNLAIGGPIVSHDLPVFVITPIAPFLSFSHPLVVSSFSHVVFVNEDKQHKAALMVDGDHTLSLNVGEELSIRPSEKFTSVAVFRKKFLTRVHQKIDPGLLNLTVRNRRSRFFGL